MEPVRRPALGAASMLAAQGRDIGSVAISMITFDIGAAAPLIALGTPSRGALMRWRKRLLKSGKSGKYLLGGLLLFVVVLIVSSLDCRLEAALVDASPTWLIQLTTPF